MQPVPYVESEMTFIDEVRGARTHYFDLDPPLGLPRRYATRGHKVRIYSARRIVPTLSVDRQGLALARHPEGNLTDFRDEAAIRSRYYPAAEHLVRTLTGARRAIVFDHTLRSSGLGQRSAEGIDTAVTEAHNDYTLDSGRERVREMLERLAPGEDAAALMRNRYAVFNVWRPTTGVVEQMPLAVCDMGTLREDDFVPVVLKWRHRTGFVAALRFDPRHRWYYFPAQGVDEAIVFKCYDSRAGAGARSAAHAAFKDPATPASARVRESIEARVIALF